MSPGNILILGASYGSLVAAKLLLTGRDVTVVCTAPTAALINEEGTIVQLPIRGRAEPVVLASREAPGTLRASVPADVDADAHDLVVLGMQEPQYAADGVRELMGRIGAAAKPAVAIMNMPPPPYLQRLESVTIDELAHCFSAGAVWAELEPALVTLASPDPQAVRPPGGPANVLRVGLPTNFKVARFADESHTQLLRELEADIDGIRFDLAGEAIELPVKLRVHDSLYVPLAKWPMLIAGNYRCVGDSAMTSIRDTVHADLETSRAVYEWVESVCHRLGAASDDLVPFDRYAAAAESLANPSSAARALAGGATAIERVDALVQGVAAQLGLDSPELDRVVDRVDRWLERNRG